MINLLSSAMRRYSKRLADDQAIVRHSRRYATSTTLSDNRIIIMADIVTENTEVETILSARFSVAATPVTSPFRQYGNDLLLKRNPRRIDEPGDVHRDAHRFKWLHGESGGTAEVHLRTDEDFCFTFVSRNHDSLGCHDCNVRIQAVIPDSLGQVYVLYRGRRQRRSVGIRSCRHRYQQLLRRLRSVQLDEIRTDNDLGIG